MALYTYGGDFGEFDRRTGSSYSGAVEDDLSLLVGQFLPRRINVKSKIICHAKGKMAGIKGIKCSPKNNRAVANGLGWIGHDQIRRQFRFGP